MIEAEGHFIDGLEWCEYTAIIDLCSNQEISCNATASVNGQIIENDCE